MDSVPQLNMEYNLYKDFNVSLEQCEKEPIHRPGAIQSFGYILIIDQSKNQLYGISKNILELTKTEEKDWWRKDWLDHLPSKLKSDLSKIINSSKVHLFNNQLYIWNELQLHLITHEFKGYLFIELENTSNYDKNEVSSYDVMENYRMESKHFIKTEDFYHAAAKHLKFFSGYDRVMVYKFHDDGHGEVVGEAREPELVPYLGLHYPVSDIPYIARKLFLINEIRIISDIERPYSSLLYRPGLHLLESFDMTHSNLRVSSPIHLEYLKNMGVQSTFTIAIKHNAKLWGLFAFHHYSPKLLSYRDRRICNYMGDYFSMSFIQHATQTQKQKQNAQYSLLDEIYKELDQYPSLVVGLESEQINLLELFGADGYFIQLNETRLTKGYTPSDVICDKILYLLNVQKSKKVFHTTSIDELIEKADQNPIGGILSLRISESADNFILLFKKPIVQIINWGGDPAKSVTAEKTDNEPLYRVSPRKSFEKFKQEIDSHSEPWSATDVDIAERFREKIKLIYLKSAGEIAELTQQLIKMKKDLDEFVYVASHDMQEPLRSILNYIELLDRVQYQQDPKAFKQFTDRIRANGERMLAMIHELLQYSRTGRIKDDVWASVSMIDIIRNVRQNLAAKIDAREAVITMDNLPDIFGLESDLNQLFQNLISNSITYTDINVRPKIHISAKRVGQHWQFSISDNGIGIEQKYHDRVFKLFERLHDQRVYQGNGIGLAICKKIIDLHHGDIWFKSTPGVGTTFYLTFNIQQ